MVYDLNLIKCIILNDQPVHALAVSHSLELIFQSQVTLQKCGHHSSLKNQYYERETKSVLSGHRHGISLLKLYFLNQHIKYYKFMIILWWNEIWPKTVEKLLIQISPFRGVLRDPRHGKFRLKLPFYINYLISYPLMTE